MKNRFADWLEKVSVASLAVGVFQNNIMGILLAFVAFIGCMYITHHLSK